MRSISRGWMSGIYVLAVSLGIASVSISFPNIAAHGQYGPPAGGFRPLPPPQFHPGISLPTDVTRTGPGAVNAPGLGNIIPSSVALRGITTMSEKGFPSQASLKGPTDWIIFTPQKGSDAPRTSPYSVDMRSGAILASVRRPSNMGMVATPLGPVAISANSDALIKYNNGVLRVFNMVGNAKSIQVNLSKGPFAGPADPVVAVAPGFELVASMHKVGRSEIRPHDGIARRHYKVLANGYAAVSEFSLESALHTSEIIADMAQRSSALHEKRILGDMSKMAAVLNYVNGTQGFTAEARLP